MAISSLLDYQNAVKEDVLFHKSAVNSPGAGSFATFFDKDGSPAAGTLAGTSLDPGVVPVAGDTGYPSISAFQGTKGYLTKVDYSCTGVIKLFLFDRLFVAGAYACADADTSFTSASFASRVPNSNYKQCQLWIEQVVTSATGYPTFVIDYLDQDGNAGSTSYAPGTNVTAKRCIPIPLAAGDSGISGITRVRCSGPASGTFNVMVLRPLWMMKCDVADTAEQHDMLRIGMPEVYATSALYILGLYASVNGQPNLLIEISNA